MAVIAMMAATVLFASELAGRPDAGYFSFVTDLQHTPLTIVLWICLQISVTVITATAIVIGGTAMAMPTAGMATVTAKCMLRRIGRLLTDTRRSTATRRRTATATVTAMAMVTGGW